MNKMLKKKTKTNNTLYYEGQMINKSYNNTGN